MGLDWCCCCYLENLDELMGVWRVVLVVVGLKVLVVVVVVVVVVRIWRLEDPDHFLDLYWEAQHRPNSKSTRHFQRRLPRPHPIRS